VLLLPTSRERRADGSTTPSPEALIEEARHRTRRRRSRRLAALLALAGVAAGGYALLTPGAPGVIRGTADSPFANARAFSDHGELAFVSRDQLWVLDGAGGALRHLRVPAGSEAASPTFSHDGRWLAYMVEPTRTNYYGPDQLWIAHGDGSGAHRVRGVRLDDLVGWRPGGDVLAVTAGQTRHSPLYSATALELVSPTGRVRALVRAPARPAKRWGIAAVGGAVWSPGGRALAVALVGVLASKLETVPVDGSTKPTVWFARGGGPVPVVGMRGRVPTEVVPKLAGWWRHRGIAFWMIDFGQSRNLDNTPLVVVPQPGAQPRYLAETLSVGVTDEVAAGPGGELALVTAGQGGREFDVGKAVETCARTGGCHAVPGATTWSGRNAQACPVRRCPPAPAPRRPGSGVSQDPQWSPNGALLAYVKAPVGNTGGWPSRAWFADHAIYVSNVKTGASRRIGKVNGSALPTWSGNGKELMYESGDSLWLMPIAIGRPVEIVHPLYAEADWNSQGSPVASISFYGQIPWKDQFSWWSPSR
jgi:hypothetical protein